MRCVLAAVSTVLRRREVQKVSQYQPKEAINMKVSTPFSSRLSLRISMYTLLGPPPQEWSKLAEEKNASSCASGKDGRADRIEEGGKFEVSTSQDAHFAVVSG